MHPANRRRRIVLLPCSACLALLMVPVQAQADDVLHPGTPTMDPSTVTALGVQLPITGDDNFTATVTLRYRRTGSTDWHDALPLVHVHTEAVTGLTVAPHFGGSVFDLVPGASYDLALHAEDADGHVAWDFMLTASTRAVPAANPAHPRAVAVTDAASLSAALSSARAGDVITLADGVYQGTFALNASGTADDPVVVRGHDRDGVVLDGMGAAGNVLEVYGSFVHLENLTIQHASRALRFQTAGAQADVVRRVHIRDVVLGIGSREDQRDFYITDNLLEGRIVWPCVYASDDPACNTDPSTGMVSHGLHANDDGIHMEGTGHVVSHNTLSGFGDALKIQQDGARGVDFDGNDVLWSYDNALELDSSAGNTRALRNRFTNSYDPLSFQPIFGGPVYAIRTVLYNVADEQFKLHSNGDVPTVGAVIYHSTVVRSARAIQCATDVSPLWFTLQDNLFVGPSTLDADGHAVAWDVPTVATATIDYNGYHPDGQYQYGYHPLGVTFDHFAMAQADGRWDAHSLLVGAAVLAHGLVGPDDWHPRVSPADVSLAAGSPAIDRGLVLPNVDDGYRGTAPDLGAIESGCAAPIYGVRPEGMDETNEVLGCVDTGPMGDGGVVTRDGSVVTGDGSVATGDGSARTDATADGSTAHDGHGGCGCRAVPARGRHAGFVMALFVAAGMRRKRSVVAAARGSV